MAFTYVILNGLFLLAVVFILLRRFHAPSKTWWITLVGILTLTVIFDNLAILSGFFSYAPDKILGLKLGVAPIEDFFYALLVCIIVPILWRRFDPKHSKKSEGREGK